MLVNIPPILIQIDAGDLEVEAVAVEVLSNGWLEKNRHRRRLKKNLRSASTEHDLGH